MPYPSSVVGWTWLTLCLDLSVAIGGCAPNVSPRCGPHRSGRGILRWPPDQCQHSDGSAGMSAPHTSAVHVLGQNGESTSTTRCTTSHIWSVWSCGTVEFRHRAYGSRFSDGASLMRHLNARLIFAVFCAIASTATAQGSSSDPRP